MEACVSSMGHLVVVVSHPIVLWASWDRATWSLREVISMTPWTSVLFLFSKAEKKKKTTFAATPGFGGGIAGKPFCLEVWVGCGGTFYRVCMPAQNLLLSDREREELPEAVRWGTV